VDAAISIFFTLSGGISARNDCRMSMETENAGRNYFHAHYQYRLIKPVERTAPLAPHIQIVNHTGQIGKMISDL
jgi:hypothetical protein